MTSFQELMIHAIMEWTIANKQDSLRMMVRAHSLSKHKALYQGKVIHEMMEVVTLDIHPQKVLGAITVKDGVLRTAIRFMGVVHQLAIPTNAIVGFWLHLEHGKDNRQLVFLPKQTNADDPKGGIFAEFTETPPFNPGSASDNLSPGKSLKPTAKSFKDSNGFGTVKTTIRNDTKYVVREPKDGEGLLDEDLKPQPKMGEVINLANFRDKTKGKPKS